nr:mannitol-1-phosphate dehydrogenase (AA 1 - 353) (mtlD) [Escherichia coli K-12]
MKALHFGAGNIGRGFIGKLLADAGIQLTFADVNQVVLDALNARHSYQVHVVGETEQVDTFPASMLSAASGDDSLICVAEVDLVTTRVGPVVLERIAPHRQRAGENVKNKGNGFPAEHHRLVIAMVRGTTQLHGHELNGPAGRRQSVGSEEHVGFVDSAVDRIVLRLRQLTIAGSDGRNLQRMDCRETAVQRRTAEHPRHGVNRQPDGHFVERKLFTLNTGHAITAYLGKLAGHQTIRDAIIDEKIRSRCKRCRWKKVVRVIDQALRHLTMTSMTDVHPENSRPAFENPYLKDDVERVGRQPLRKLSAGDRTDQATARYAGIWAATIKPDEVCRCNASSRSEDDRSSGTGSTDR